MLATEDDIFYKYKKTKLRMMILQIEKTCGFLKGTLATTKSEDNISSIPNLEMGMKISFYRVTAM